ncbi:hypothetical protein [Natrinema halophilum]|uniref:Uncharacterized protein n=1 Tax=Natrinema halophilum TaxID=1699371 RepID=A0A7D5KZX2_9EURY|nr:hypothetical protein [Natrinema halophilum]QLG50320.1 hypothetical protein HYG82_16460 [Natrinema halophilum]
MARWFAEATELHYIMGETNGVMVAVDAGAIDDIREIVDLSLDADSKYDG